VTDDGRNLFAGRRNPVAFPALLSHPAPKAAPRLASAGKIAHDIEAISRQLSATSETLLL
jgi:hypothetical protein